MTTIRNSVLALHLPALLIGGLRGMLMLVVLACFVGWLIDRAAK